jgi:hypothetical protein
MRLKKNVIQPILFISKRKQEIPSIEEIKDKSNIYSVIEYDQKLIDESGQLIYDQNIILDCDLCIDFLENHYPQLIDIWNKTYNAIRERENNLGTLRNHIIKTLEKQIGNIFLTTSTEIVVKFKHEKFSDQLVNKFIKNQYDSNLFTIEKTSHENLYDLNFPDFLILRSSLKNCNILKE